MKVGFYKSDLEEVVGYYDIEDSDCIEYIAQDFADKNHQIDEESDMNFTVYVEDDNGCLHEVRFYTEYDPIFAVDSVVEL